MPHVYDIDKYVRIYLCYYKCLNDYSVKSKYKFLIPKCHNFNSYKDICDPICQNPT